MKDLKVIVIATLVTCLIILGCSHAMATELGEYYPKLTVVITSEQIEDDLYIVSCRDREGNIWQFYDDEGIWKPGDIANLLIWNCGEIKYHEIIDVVWEGYSNNFNLF